VFLTILNKNSGANNDEFTFCCAVLCGESENEYNAYRNEKKILEFSKKML